MCTEKSTVFACSKCGFKTSGIPDLTQQTSARRCAKCNSPLIRCPHCFAFTSGTTQGTITYCDNCKKPLPDKGATGVPAVLQ